HVRTSPMSRAADLVHDMQSGFVLVFGSALSDESDYFALAHAARTRCLPFAMWLTDDPYEFDAAYKFVELADVVFTNDRWTRSYYRRPHVFHLPMAASKRRQFRPVASADSEYGYDIFFCGVGFSQRQRVIDGLATVLKRYHTVICGDEWRENAP